MKILYHHRTRGRGVESVHICGVTRALEELGHQVDLLSFPGAHPKCSGRQTDSGRAHSLLTRLFNWFTARLPEFMFELSELGYNLIAMLRMGRRLRRLRPDLVYERYALFMFAGVWLACRYRIPIVLEINDSALVERVRPLFFQGLARRTERWAFRHCSGLVFVSGRFRTEAAEAYGDLVPWTISPNAADARLFVPSPTARADVRREFGIESKVVCGYVGAFVHWHGIDWFVREIAPALKGHPELVLLLVGDGRLYEEVRAFVRDAALDDKVIFSGRVQHAQVARLIAAMDFAVLPDSNTYGSPMKLFELMAMGIGVVAPDFEPLTEVIDDGRIGWLFPARARRACIERVLEVCADRVAQQRVGAAARAYVVHNRQWTNNARQLIELYEQVKTPA